MQQTSTSMQASLKKWMPQLCGFLLVSILFFPAISIGENRPAFEVVDFLMPVLGLIAILLYKDIYLKGFLLLLAGFGSFILLSMILNHRLSYVSDYFEIYKIIKFIVLISLFSFIHPPTFYTRWIPPVFIGLVVFNVLHYFNVFHINVFLENVYFGHNNYNEFGLNSAGLPNAKRMMGFTANPNNNAMIFGLFAILFLPKKTSSPSSFWFFGIALLMMFLCQSRTAVMALPAILIAYAVLEKNLKRTLLVSFVALGSFGISHGITVWSVGVGTPPDMEKVNAFIEKYPGHWWDPEKQTIVKNGVEKVDFTYLESMMHGQFTEGTSMKGRYEIWLHLWDMIKKKPLVGHGPYKEYFYENKLYAENEFIFMAWRYGFIGLVIFCSILGSLAISAFRYRHLPASRNLLMFLVLFCVTALTNLPFASTTLNMIFAIVIGLFLADLRTQHPGNDTLKWKLLAR